MLLQEDLDTIANMTGLSEAEVMANDTLGDEYILRQRMYHAAGNQGALPAIAVIDLLRHLGFTPAALPAPLKPLEIRWDDIRIGTRVLVTPDDKAPHKQLYGTFRGKPEPGYLSILLDGAVGGYVDEFAMRQVVLAPAGAPAYVAPAEPLVESLVETPEPEKRINALFEEGEVAAEVSFPANEPLEPGVPEVLTTSVTVDRADPEGRIHVPKMTRDWSNVDPGDPVLFKDGDSEVEGQWIEDGPTDGHVTIFVNDKNRVVPEELVEV